MKEGFYERIYTKGLLRQLDASKSLVVADAFKKEDGAIYINRFFQQLIQRAFEQLSSSKDEMAKSRIIELSNQIIELIAQYNQDQDFLEELIVQEGTLLKALFDRTNFGYNDVNAFVKEHFPYTGLSESELFTGSRAGISLESELKKEMLTSNEVWWLVSFVKFEGIRLFESVLKSLEQKDIPVKIICTVYMGATDLKAIDFLSKFSNVQLKISFNTRQERLHAKAYLFRRNTGFHTGYIGSSNLSKSALTSGLEWNLKITQQEIPHIIEKCKSTFETYWHDQDFELYHPETHRERLIEALRASGLKSSESVISSFFDITPFDYQQDILDRLEECRSNGEMKNLVVAATGTGKTVMAAFDIKRFLKNNPQCKFLFVAHREEILKQAQFTFRQVLRDNSFGELWYGGQSPSGYTQLFVSVQTLNSRIEQLALSSDYYDYIIIDEVHHSAAMSYQKLLGHFNPRILLGLTATPERMDGKDISAFFGNTISAEIRLAEALNKKLLCPFHYFGLADNVDLSRISWRKGKYDVSELEVVYTEDDRRVRDILTNCEKYLLDTNAVTCVGFCVSKKHAFFMSQKFNAAGYKSNYLTSDNSVLRETIINDFKRGKINYLFVVDIFNEGIDIPEIDTMLLLRPTESLTIFLQQLGRGLRKHDEKMFLTVLDFIGRARGEYSFEHKFRGLLGKTHTRIKDEVEKDFPHLPLGCSIVLERVAKEYILNNLSQNISGGKRKLIKAIQQFQNSYEKEVTLKDFTELMEVSLDRTYGTKMLWNQLVLVAKGTEITPSTFEERLAISMCTQWLSCDSRYYFEFIQKQVKLGFSVPFNPEEIKWGLMIYVDLFNEAPKCETDGELREKLRSLFSSTVIKQEVDEYFSVRKNDVQTIEKSSILNSELTLKLHGRYTRNQILIAFGKSNLEKLATSREGVLVVDSINAELLFVTLDKSKGKFNPSTMYHDYFINEDLFHWQSQNATSADSPKGQSYINHVQSGKQILLFVREANEDERGLTMAYIFCGKLRYLSHEGDKPMSIIWKMETPPPAFLLSEGKKLAIG